MDQEPPSSDHERAWTRLMRASRLTLSAVEGALKAQGLPPLAWYDVLLALDRAPKAGLRPFELSDLLLLAQFNMSRLLSRLEAAGLVRAGPCADDRRGQIIRITPAGRRLRKRMWAVYGPAIETSIGGRLSRAESRQLAVLLAKLDRPRK